MKREDYIRFNESEIRYRIREADSALFYVADHLKKNFASEDADKVEALRTLLNEIKVSLLHKHFDSDREE